MAPLLLLVELLLAKSISTIDGSEGSDAADEVPVSDTECALDGLTSRSAETFIKASAAAQSSMVTVRRLRALCS